MIENTDSEHLQINSDKTHFSENIKDKNYMKVLFHYDAGEKLQEKLKKLSEQGLDVICCTEGLNDKTLEKKYKNVQVIKQQNVQIT